MDLNGDGLPDILKTDSGGGAHQAWLNRGEVRLDTGRAIRWDAPVDVDSSGGTAWNFNLSSTSTHLADMDGDGLADLVNKSAEGDVFYFPNLGHTAWGPRRDMSVQDSPPLAGNRPGPLANVVTQSRATIKCFIMRIFLIHFLSGSYRGEYDMRAQ